MHKLRWKLVQVILKFALKKSLPHNLIDKKEIRVEFKEGIAINAEFRDTNHISSKTRNKKNHFESKESESRSKRLSTNLKGRKFLTIANNPFGIPLVWLNYQPL